MSTTTIISSPRAVVCGRASLIGTCLMLVTGAEAGSRHFAYSYESTTMAAGAMELESWVTWKTGVDSDRDFERFDIRHEFEYGYSDRLQLALYFADWRYQESATEPGKAEFRNIAVEAIYNLTDPNICALGSALYGEVKLGDDFVELEMKLLLQKNIGAWMIVYNLGAEIEWEHDYDDDEGELVQSLGVCYQINPSFSVGVEALHEVALPDVESFGDNAVYFGPNVSWRKGRVSLALAGLWQITSLSDEPDFQLRTIVAMDF